MPLSRRAIATLIALHARSTGESYVFPSPYYPKKTTSENTINSALARMGFNGIATAHGFRSLFSTVADEQGHDADVIERHWATSNETRSAPHTTERRTSKIGRPSCSGGRTTSTGSAANRTSVQGEPKVTGV